MTETKGQTRKVMITVYIFANFIYLPYMLIF